MSQNTNKIRELNDLFRQTSIGGKIRFSEGVANLSDEEKQGLLTEVRSFKKFTKDNDPHKEHDMAFFNFQGDKYFWKIDYFDLKEEYHSPDASNPKVTKRILTIAFTDEY